MNNVYNYGSSISMGELNEVVDLLHEGMKVDFSCGLQTVGDGDHTSYRYQSHVNDWAEYIEDRYKRRYGKKVVVNVKYRVEEHPGMTRFYLPNKSMLNNKHAAELLDNHY